MPLLEAASVLVSIARATPLQEALENASVCLLNAGPTGSETLKNLVLGGIASFTIVDGAKARATPTACLVPAECKVFGIAVPSGARSLLLPALGCGAFAAKQSG